MDEKELLIGIRQGKNKAFKNLYEQHYGVLCSVAYNYVGDDYLAKTIAGDVIVKLWIERDRVHIDRSLRMYLMRSVRNQCLDYIKSQYHRREVSSSVYIEHALNASLIDDTNLGHLLEHELEDKIAEAMVAIPLESRRVFIMSRFHDMSYHDIAQSLDISVNTVKYHIKHALVILRGELEKYLKE